MDTPQILVVEDNISVSHTIDLALHMNGPIYSLFYVYDGAQALELIQDIRPDLIILDIILPSINGYQIARRLRSYGNMTPILMLTALQGESSELKGFESGCDDYVRKPFTPKLLYTRVEALLRRTKLQQERYHVSLLSFANIMMNVRTQVVHRGGDPITLSPMEYRVLKCFLEHPEELLTRDWLLERIWRNDQESDSNLVDVTISHLRKKLGEPLLIHTIRASGFILR